MMDRELSAEQREALERHGYDADLLPRGVSGGPQRERVSWAAEPPANAWPGWPYLRNQICELDDLLIDGHEFTDLEVPDYDSTCLYCGKELQEILRDEERRGE